ncbi:MAG: ATP-binding cassette domain-containing protein [Promethearchaeota archaeon]
MSEICIEFNNVSKNYKDLIALDNISFEVQKGDIFGYIGPNGAGKTTTIKILVGLITDFDGKVSVYRDNVLTNRKNLHKIIGYHPQEAGFQEWRTIDHAYKSFGRLSGLTSYYLENRINDILDLIGLTDFRYKKITHLSGGMLQKLRLGQALLHEPEILVLDEPLSGLDPTSRFQFKGIIRELAKKGITILFSSHILSDVQDIASKIGILNQGKVMKIGSPEELQNSFHIGNLIEITVAENTPLCEGLEMVSEVDYVEKIKDNRQVVHLKSNIDIDVSISKIMNVLLQQNCKLRNLALLKPSLEDVYLKYVGGEFE